MPTRFPYGLSFLKPHGVASTGGYTFTAGDITPDVSQGTFFFTCPTSAVTITRFDGGEYGKIIYVLQRSGTICTIQDSAGSIVTSRYVIAPYASGSGLTVTTAGDLALQTNELVGFINAAGTWYQLDKSVQ